MSDVVPFRGEQYLTMPGDGEDRRFREGVTRHHRPAFDDYTVSKLHITEAIGDITDTDVFGRNVLCAVFARPNISPGGIIQPVKAMQEDWYQHKVVLVLKMGPEAFKGDDSYTRAMFPRGETPKAGEWLYANANAGIQINLIGEGAYRPQGKTFGDEMIDIYEWDGWPCRIIPDDQFLGRLEKPHSVI